MIISHDLVPIELVTGPGVPVDREALDQALEFASLASVLPPEFGRIRRIVLTPDLHRGPGIPVGSVVETEGFVIPKAVGNDICCGVRLCSVDVTADELSSSWNQLKTELRGIFFEGKRNIPMSPRQRRALIREGLWGLWETSGDNAGVGIWEHYDPSTEYANMERTHACGSLPTSDAFAFDSFIEASGGSDSRDVQIGSVGGGNHFVEIQRVEEVVDGYTARLFGLHRGHLTIMAHSGSVGLGHVVGGYFMDLAKTLWPAGTQHPREDFFVIPESRPKELNQYLSALHCAANFAFGNRLFLVLMVVKALSAVLGRVVKTSLVYDAPHNLVWKHDSVYVHRKGATPAPGVSCEFPTGCPVIVPGSMGDASWVLAGAGNDHYCQSACHGAGRAMTRMKASKLNAPIENLMVVTPVDPAILRTRRDIAEKHRRRLLEESPRAYKPVTPVVDAVTAAGIARPVAKLWPLLTVKG